MPKRTGAAAGPTKINCNSFPRCVILPICAIIKLRGRCSNLRIGSFRTENVESSNPQTFETRNIESFGQSKFSDLKPLMHRDFEILDFRDMAHQRF